MLLPPRLFWFMEVIFELAAVKYVLRSIMNSENSIHFGLTVQIQILK